MMKIALLTIGFAGLIGVAACSSDRALTITTSNAADPQASLPPGVSIPDLTVPPDLSLPPGVTIPDISDVSIPDLSLPPGITLPPGVTIPDISDLTIPDISDLTVPEVVVPTGSIDPDDLADCTTFTKIFGAVFTGTDSGIDDIPAAFEELAKNIPADLADDLEAVQKGFIRLQAVLEKFDYDYNKLFTDPEALAVFSDTEFITAIGTLEQYYGTQCGAVPG